MSPAQREALRHYANGDAAGESWAQYDKQDRLAWYRHERTIDSLERHGWIDDDGITPAGRAALGVTNEEIGFCPCKCTCGPGCDHRKCPCAECAAERARRPVSTAEQKGATP